MISSSSGNRNNQGGPKFSARLPFVISPGRVLELVEPPVAFNLGGHQCQVVRESHQYALTICGLPSEKDAQQYLLRAAAGLFRVGLKHSIGFRFDRAIKRFKSLSKPMDVAADSPYYPITVSKGWRQIDGFLHADASTIYPEEQRLVKVEGHPATVSLGVSKSVFEQSFSEMANAGCPERLFENHKLRLAIEFYMSSLFEISAGASFLWRFTTLEILVPATPVSVPIQKKLNDCIDLIRGLSASCENDADAHTEIQSVLTRLEHTLNKSITSGLRDIIRNKLMNDPELSSQELAREVGRLYGIRSNLVHNGDAAPAEIANGNERLGFIVPQLLRALFREAAAEDTA